jgi:amidohydrolase
MHIDRSDLSFIDRFLADHLDELVAFRRTLHAHPELSWHEHATTERIAERLRVAGLEPRVLSTGTGLVCDVGEGGGPVVAIRGDIDALPLDDEKDVPYRSQVPGVAHACGHDVHATVTLGAGLAWARHRPGGRLRLVFEPAEESVPGGAPQVVADGGLDGVAVIFGVHCDPRFDAGEVAVRAGPITSAADSVDITLTGPGGHTARPHETIDLVPLAGRVAQQLPGRARELAALRGELLLAFGAIHAGEAHNVIPTHAVLRASVRTPDPALWAQAEAIVREALAELTGGSGAQVDCTYTRGVPPLVNDPDAAELVVGAARAILGPSAVREAQRSAGADTFAWYLEEVPGCYVRLGTHTPGDDRPRRDLHAGTFDVDERAIAVGIRTMLAAAVAAHATEAAGAPAAREAR